MVMRLEAGDMERLKVVASCCGVAGAAALSDCCEGRPTAAASGDSQESFGSCCGLLI